MSTQTITSVFCRVGKGGQIFVSGSVYLCRGAFRGAVVQVRVRQIGSLACQEPGQYGHEQPQNIPVSLSHFRSMARKPAPQSKQKHWDSASKRIAMAVGLPLLSPAQTLK